MAVKWLIRKNKIEKLDEINNNIIEKCVVYYIPCDRIRPNPMRSRNDFTEENLVDLACSIKKYGIIQPLCVSKTEDGDSYDYALIAGERRLRAARLAGKAHVPCIILDIGEPLAAELSLIENISRSDIDYFEVSAAIKRLSELYEESFEEICLRLSIRQDEALKKLLLLEFDFEERQMLLNSDIPEDIALDIVRNIDVSNRKEVIKRLSSARDLSTNVIDFLPNDCSESHESKEKFSLPRDVSSVIRGIERRIKLLNRNKDRASFAIDNSDSETVITLRIIS